MIQSLRGYLETSPHTKAIAGTSIVACISLFLIGWIWMLWVIAKNDRLSVKNSVRIPFFILFWGFANLALAKKPLVILILSLGGFAFLVWILPKQAKRSAQFRVIPRYSQKTPMPNQAPEPAAPSGCG